MTLAEENNDFFIAKLPNHPLFRNAAIYILSNIARAALPFFLIPVLTRYLSPADYGIIATFDILTTILVVCVGLNAHGAVAATFFKLPQPDRKIYAGNSIFLLLANFIVVFCFFCIFKSVFSSLLKFPAPWFPILVVIALANATNNLLLTTWQMLQKPINYGAFQFIQTLLNFGLSLYFVVALGWHWEGRLWGVALSSFLFCFISLYLLYRANYVRFCFNRKYLKDMLAFGLPLIPHSLGSWLIASTDRIFLTLMIGISTTGLYAAGYQIGMVIDIISQSFNSAFVPFLFTQLGSNNFSAKIKIVKLTYILFAFYILLALTLVYLAPFIFKIFIGKAFFQGYEFVKWIALGGAAKGMYYLVANYLFYIKKTHILAWITIASATMNILLTYILIKLNGAIGAAQATMISLFISFILVWIASAKCYAMPWDLRPGKSNLS